MTGTLSILNVGDGDTKLSFDPKKPAERERAARVVTDMIKQGFAILVEVGKRKGEPLYQRAKSFDPETCEYIIVGVPEDGHEKATASPKAKTKKTTTRRVPAAKTRSVAVARSAGG